MISIMQPTFLPWLGYFFLMKNADTFVFLNDVQLEKTGWQRRNYIIDQKLNKEKLVTIPIDKSKSFRAINDTKVVFGRDYDSVINRIMSYYSMNKNFELIQRFILDPLQNFRSKSHDPIYVDEINLEIILGIARWLEIDTKFLLSSEIGNFSHDKIKRLVEINKTCGSDCYLTTPGALGYMSDRISQFSSENIRLMTVKIMNESYLKMPQNNYFYSLPSILANYSHVEISSMLLNGNVFQLEDVN